eukprot:7497262-Prorocentrum_lima.AAC.1
MEEDRVRSRKVACMLPKAAALALPGFVPSDWHAAAKLALIGHWRRQTLTVALSILAFLGLRPSSSYLVESLHVLAHSREWTGAAVC